MSKPASSSYRCLLWQPFQTVREKFSCRSCEAITQPPAPFHVTPRGFAGPNLLAMILFEKFGQHQPLNRQSERYAREGIDLSVSTLADQVTGREDELYRLDEILIHDKPAVVTQAVGRVAVQGMGGVGKTSLAVEYAYQYRNLYAGVCWCPAETRAVLMNALKGLGAALGDAASEQADAEKAAKGALHRLAGQRATWLLVYDNVASPNEIAGLLPSAGARVLITSRFSDWSGLADEVALTILAPEEAAAFLQDRAGRKDATGARALAEALGCLPLALDHAAAFCKRTQASFAEYANKASSFIAKAPRDAMHPRSVAATFDLAIGEAEARCSAAEQPSDECRFRSPPERKLG
jgi:hypothetical protein